MLLSALVLVGALRGFDAPPPPAPPPPREPPAKAAVPFAHAPRMKGQRPAWECRRRATLARETGDQTAKPLKRMPMGLGERAVMRMVDGCPVRTPIIQSAPRR